MKSLKNSTVWQNVPFDNANLRLLLINTFEKIQNLVRYFNNTKLPGNQFGQQFFGKLEENVYCPKDVPCICGFKVNDPDVCFESE